MGGRFPRFASREMEAMYIEELRSSVNLLMANLESMPVSKGGEFKLQKLKRGHNASIMDMGQEDENTLSKSDVVLSFTLEVGDQTVVLVIVLVYTAFKSMWVGEVSDNNYNYLVFVLRRGHLGLDSVIFFGVGGGLRYLMLVVLYLASEFYILQFYIS